MSCFASWLIVVIVAISCNRKSDVNQSADSSLLEYFDDVDSKVLGPIRRLDEIGGNYRWLNLTAKAFDYDLIFTDSRGGHAEWKFIRNVMQLPKSYDNGNGEIRYELQSDELSTVFHELTHAYYDLFCENQKTQRDIECL